ANRAALKTFGLQDSDPAGRSFTQFLTKDSADKLRGLLRALDDTPEERLWVPGGLEGRTTDGGSFPAEASLSSFQFGGERRYTLILRNIHDQIEAETKIAALTGESAYLQEEIGGLYNFGEIRGHSRAYREMLTQIHQVGPTDATVL